MNPESPDIRVSDQDREQVIAVLRSATGEGRLTLDEFSELAGAVFAARTRGELDAVLANLPLPVERKMPPPGAGPVPAQTGGAAPTTRSGTAPASRTIIAVMSGQKRKGRWRVAEQTTAFAFWGGIDLDLRGAIIEGTVVEITAVAIMGGIDITVPEGIPVEMDGFVLMGGSDNRVRDLPVLPGAPLIRVKAYGMWGGVSVRSKPTEREHGRGRSSRERGGKRPRRGHRHPGRAGAADADLADRRAHTDAAPRAPDGRAPAADPADQGAAAAYHGGAAGRRARRRPRDRGDGRRSDGPSERVARSTWRRTAQSRSCSATSNLRRSTPRGSVITVGSKCCGRTTS